MPRTKSNNRRRKSRYSDLEKFAWKLGKINSSLNSGAETRVRDSYNNGLNGVTPNAKKPLV